MTTAEQIRQYVSCIYRPDDCVELRALKNGEARKFWHQAHTLPGILPELQRLNAAGWNIYAGPNPRKAEKLSGDENVLLCRALFVDFDHIPAGDGMSPSEIVLGTIEEKTLPVPTMVTYSGHGVHAYWRLQEPMQPERWHTAQERLNALLGSDPVIKNPERIMRLPGFTNHKPPASESFVIQADPGLTYAVETIEAVLPTPATKIAAPSAPLTAAPSAKTAKARAVLYADKWQPSDAGSRNNDAFRHATQLCRDFDLGEADAWEILADWNKTNCPPLDEEELRAAFRNAQKYGKKSPGCKLAEPPRAAHRPVQLPATAAGPEPAAELENLIEAQIDGRFVNLPWPWPSLTDLGQCLTPQTRTIIVGSTGGSKSLLILQALSLWVEQGLKVAALELERSRDFHLARILAQRTGIADITKPRWVRDNAEKARALFREHHDYLNRIGTALHTVPRTFTIVQAAEWVEERTREGCRIIVLDPVTALLRGRDSWVDDEQFVARIEKAARTSDASLICVTHPRKGGSEMPSLDNIAGGAAWARFPDAVLWLESHPTKLSTLRVPCGTDEQAHNRTLWLLKTRSGEGEHLRLAFKFEAGKENDDGALTLRELGIIVKNPKGAKTC